MKHATYVLPTVSLLLVIAGGAVSGAADVRWNQFRGPNGQGCAPDAAVPAHFGPQTNVAWKTAVPAGHSSPVVWDDAVFLTAAEPGDQGALLTLAYAVADGQLRWRQALTPGRVGPMHPLNHRASPTPAVDAQRVYVCFGAAGVAAYTHAGVPAWERRLEMPRSKYGMATSPILHRGTLILALDGDGGTSRLLALRTDTGETVWEQPRALFKPGWSTPMIFTHDGVEDLVVLGSKRLTAHDPATGEERWWAGGFPEETVGVPVSGGDLLFAGAAALGGRGDDELDAATTWRTTVQEFDRDRDNQIQRVEMTEGFAFIQRPELPRDNPGYGLPVRDMDALLRIFDHDRNGVISEAEWMGTMAGFAAVSHPALVAFRPGARGDARPGHVAWEIRRGVPETPSMLHWQGRLYLLRDGGLLTCLEAATGREVFRERLGAGGQYIASPILAGDHLITASVGGVVTVIRPGDTLQVVARNGFPEAIHATPAAVGRRLYLRTSKHLYAFGP